jgi:hypothetical protein
MLLHSNAAADFGENMPRQLLSQFRWLDNVVESKRLATKLMEVLKVCPAEYMQREIITSVPDIIDDYGHEVTIYLFIYLFWFWFWLKL